MSLLISLEAPGLESFGASTLSGNESGEGLDSLLRGRLVTVTGV